MKENNIKIEAGLIKTIRVHFQWSYRGCCDSDHIVVRIPYEQKDGLIAILAERLSIEGVTSLDKAYICASIIYVLTPKFSDGFKLDFKEDTFTFWDELDEPHEDLGKTQGMTTEWFQEQITHSVQWKQGQQKLKERIEKSSREKFLENQKILEERDRKRYLELKERFEK